MPAKVVIDIDGADAMSGVLLGLLNRFPGLIAGDKIVVFTMMAETSGIGFYPVSGPAVQNDIEDVTGHVTQICVYPFSIVYRAAPKSEKQRMRIKEFLDALGRWLERQPVVISGVEQQLTDYPTLTTGRRIKSIARTSPAYLNAAYQDGIEDWIIGAQMIYENEFDR